MSNITGMNIEAITGQVVPGLQRQSEAVLSVIQEVGRLIGVVQQDWVGPDSQQFIQKWEGEYRGPLQRLAEELADLSRTAARNAETQRQTSSGL